MSTINTRPAHRRHTVPACCICDRPEIIPERFERRSANNRGGKPALICPDCLSLLPYSAENSILWGVDTKGRTYSTEWEMNEGADYVEAARRLLTNGAIPTSDCTVDVEFISPIYRNLKSPVRILKTVERICKEGLMSIGDNCGTHFHVGLPKNAEGVDGMSAPIDGIDGHASRMDAARNMVNSLFVPVTDWMLSHPVETEALFGRNFGRWAEPINPRSHWATHENWVNMQHDYSLEFRLPRFRNHRQYARAMHTCDRFFSTLETHFWSKYNAARSLAERKALAAKAARYMVRELEKACAEALPERNW